MSTDYQVSAGGLVVREETVLLISIASGRRWQLPKGHIEAGETAEQAAVREVREETGISGRVVAPLPGVEYWFVERGRKQVHKQVHYFLLAFLSGDTANYDPTEVSGASWFSWDEALTRLTFDNERRVVAAARELLSARPGLLAEGEPAA